MKVSRRHWMVGSAAVLGHLALSKRALAAPPLLLPDPDFTRLHPQSPQLVGVRPYRTGGVRLERTRAPWENPLGPVHLIHNYGHGGAGVTLSWGCAAHVTDLVAEVVASGDPKIAILGTGVIGLTTAWALRRRFARATITIYAKDLDVTHTTSFVAGGQFQPSGLGDAYRDPEGRTLLAGWLRRSKATLLDFGSDAARWGIAERDNYTLDHAIQGFDDATPHDVVPPFSPCALPFARLQAPGRRYRSWIVNPTMLLPVLVEELSNAKVIFNTRTFDTISDVARLGQQVVINCTGYGAKTLFSDATLLAKRGHLVRLERTDPAQNYLFGGGCENWVNAYIFCRQDDIIIGGTYVSGDERRTIEEDDGPVFERILENAKLLFDGQPLACVR